jgi:hypothetical protein
VVIVELPGPSAFEPHAKCRTTHDKGELKLFTDREEVVDVVAHLLDRKL